MSNGKFADNKTFRLTGMALLIAIIALMAFTPLGYLKTAGVEITFILIPVIIGAIIFGPGAGAVLGTAFGATSFIQCFGMSPFGATLLGINPIFTFVLCMVPRILMGWLTGLIFKALNKIDKTKLISYAAANLSGALLNTIMFTGLLLVLFGSTDYIQGIADAMGTKNIWAFAVAFVGLNGLVEAIVCFVAGTAVSKALALFLDKLKTRA